MAEAQKTNTEKKQAEKTVTIRIPITRDETGDVYVSVNDRSWLIQRGKDVKAPECVAEQLRHRDIMLEQVALREGTK